jgi:hypothetical protein
MAKWWKQKRKKRAAIVPLIPTEWYPGIYPGHIPDNLNAPTLVQGKSWWKPSREEIQAHLKSCYGNIYSKKRNSFMDGVNDIPKEGNHMLLDALVGAGCYLGITWLNLQTNRRWEESIRMVEEPYEIWVLVSALEVD